MMSHIRDGRTHTIHVNVLTYVYIYFFLLSVPYFLDELTKKSLCSTNQAKHFFTLVSITINSHLKPIIQLVDQSEHHDNNGETFDIKSLPSLPHPNPCLEPGEAIQKMWFVYTHHCSVYHPLDTL